MEDDNMGMEEEEDVSSLSKLEGQLDDPVMKSIKVITNIGRRFKIELLCYDGSLNR